MSGDKSAHLNCGLWYEMMPVAHSDLWNWSSENCFSVSFAMRNVMQWWNTHRATSSQWNYTNFKGETAFYCPVTDWCHYMQ